MEYQIVEKKTVTFTKSRFIQEGAIYDRNTGELLDNGNSDQGRYTLNADGTITRIWLEHPDDDYDAPKEPREVVKQYTLLGDELYLEDWFHDRPGTSFDYHKRATQPDFEGTWVHVEEYENDEGVMSVSTVTITISGDSFTFSNIGRPIGGPVDNSFQLSGTFELDSEELFLFVTIQEVTENGESLEIEAFEPGNVVRFAFAPTDEEDRIRVSQFNDEQSFRFGAWVDRTDNPYGDYWKQFIRDAS